MKKKFATETQRAQRRFRSLFSALSVPVAYSPFLRRFGDRHALERIVPFDLVDDVLAALDLAEDGVLAVEPVGDDVGDEEL